MSLSKLIEAIASDTLRPSDDWDCLRELFPMSQAEIDAGDYESDEVANIRNAFHGSLDAAKRLHDALLPGWTVDNMGQRAGGWLVRLGRFDGKTPRPAPEAMIRDNHARAWLLAILRALEQEGRE